MRAYKKLTLTTLEPRDVPAAAIAAFSAFDGSEGERPVTFTLSRDDTTGALTVPVDVTHRPGQPFGSPPMQVSAPVPYVVEFLPGEELGTLTITPADDAEYLTGELYTLTVRPPTDGSYTLTNWTTINAGVLDNEPAPYVWIEDAVDAVDRQTEGFFRLRRTNAFDELHVSYQIDPGATTATEGSDFVSLSGTVTFPAGMDSVIVVIDPRQAPVVAGEPAETVGILLTSAVTAGGLQVPVNPGPGPKPVVIQVPAAGAPSFQAPNYTFEVGRKAPKGTVVGDLGYTTPGGFDKIEITQGNGAGLFKIAPTLPNVARISVAKEIPADAPNQYNLTVQVTDRAGQTASVNVTINVRTLVVVYGDSDATEGDRDNIHLTFARLGSTAGDLTVMFKYVWGTATADDLAQPLPGTPVGNQWSVTIPAGSTDAHIDLSAVTDLPVEVMETFRIELQPSLTGSYALLWDQAVSFWNLGTQRGERNIDARIFNGLRLFAADNGTADLKDLNPDGSLMNPGISTNDVNQGNLGDCDFLAPVIALIKMNPLAIADRMTQRETADGPVVDVTFFTSPTRTQTITVPLALTNGARQAELSADRKFGAYEVWPQILEAGYAKFRYGGDIGKMEEGVTTNDVWKHLTGKEVEALEPSVPPAERETRIRAAVQAGKQVVLYSPPQTQKGPDGDDIPGSHAFVLDRIVGNDIYYRNPHDYGIGPQIRKVTFAQLAKYFPSTTARVHG